MKNALIIASAGVLMVCILVLLAGGTSTRALAACPLGLKSVVTPACAPVNTPTPAPTATPVPAPTATAPAATTPTASDISELTALINRPSATVTSIAIVGNFAEACWMNGSIGGAILATNTSGSWVQIDAVFGGYAPGDITSRVPSISLPIAQALAAQASLNEL